MGTRCGDIDPAIVTYLFREERTDLARPLAGTCGGCGGERLDIRIRAGQLFFAIMPI